MAKFYNIIFIAAVIVIVYFGTQALTAPQDEKIEAFNSSLTAEKNNNYNEAISRLNKIYEANKQNYLINLRLGWLNYLKGSFDQSKKYYRTAIALTSEKSIEPYLGLALPLSANQEWDELKAIYEKVLNLDPNNFNANLYLGQIYMGSKDYQNAKKYLEKAYTSYKAAYEINSSLGWTYFYLGDKKKANDFFTAALMLNPKDSLATQGYDLTR